MKTGSADFSFVANSLRYPEATSARKKKRCCENDFRVFEFATPKKGFRADNTKNKTEQKKYSSGRPYHETDKNNRDQFCLSVMLSQLILFSQITVKKEVKFFKTCGSKLARSFFDCCKRYFSSEPFRRVRCCNLTCNCAQKEFSTKKNTKKKNLRRTLS